MYYQKSLNLRLLIAVILTIVGSGLLIAGFIVPPVGVINGSVLVAFGETSTFIAALLGIDYNYKWKIYKHGLANKIKEHDDEIM